MATSTSTLLDVVNRVLVNSNERPIAATTTLVGQQVKESVRMALMMLVNQSQWAWTQDKINATTWSTSQATLATTTSMIRSVSWDNGDGILLPLKYVSRQVFDQIAVDTYSTATGRALWYTLLDYNVALINPYPTGATEQNKIWFYVVKTIALPSSDSTTFAIPEEFVNTLVVMATQLFLKRDQEDYLQVAMQELQRKMTKHLSVPATEYSMVRGWRNYGN